MKKLLKISEGLKDKRSLAFFVAIFVLLPNILFYSLAFYIDAARPVIALEYILAALPLALSSSKYRYHYSALLLTFCVFADIILIILSKFNFDFVQLFAISRQDFLDTAFIKDISFSFILNDPTYRSITACFILLATSIFYFFTRIKKLNCTFQLSQVAFCFTVLSIAGILCHFTKQKDQGIVIANMLFKPQEFFMEKQAWDGIYTANFKPTKFSAPLAVDKLFKDVDSNKINYDKILLIVVEGLGAFKDKVIEDILISELNDKELNNHYTITTGAEPYDGSTINGEFRNLCGVRLSSKWIPDEDHKDALNICLPYKLKQKGYDIIMMHNSRAEYYDRKRWYKFFDPDEIYFSDDVADEFGLDISHGNSFKGALESELFDKAISKIIATDKKQFLHLMTLEGHLPLDLKPNVSDNFRKICGTIHALKNSLDVCELIETHHNLLGYIKKLALELKDKKVLFIISGDHKPSFIEPSKSRLYKKGLVTNIIIESK